MSQHVVGESLAVIQDRGRGAAQSKKPIEADDWIFAFDRPHEIGTVCRFPCPQCGIHREMQISGIGYKKLPPTPLAILAEATADQWRRHVLARGGAGKIQPGISYYYFVRAD